MNKFVATQSQTHTCEQNCKHAAAACEFPLGPDALAAHRADGGFLSGDGAHIISELAALARSHLRKLGRHPAFGLLVAGGWAGGSARARRHAHGRRGYARAHPCRAALSCSELRERGSSTRNDVGQNRLDIREQRCSCKQRCSFAILVKRRNCYASE